ncbi:MAG: FAS1 domain-containing protein [Benjaminiella poitrasii]|nr:MAG: FAS1 domain-containing protein [Benjaminiella poitrasii]
MQLNLLEEGNMLLLLLSLLVFFSMTSTAQRLLYEPDYRTQANQQSLFDKLAPDPALSTFMDALTQVDDILQLLNSTERNHEEYTVFCPINSAFFNRSLWRAYGGPDDLDAFLRKHIVPRQKLSPSDLSKARQQQFPTLLDGQTIQVRYHIWSQRVVLNEHAQVVNLKHPVEAINGIAYKIDHLL